MWLIFFYGSLFLTLENLDVYNKMQAIIDVKDARPVPSNVFTQTERDELDSLNGNLYTFHFMFYYFIVTSITAGYGDISPTTQLSRWLVIIMITNSIFAIAQFFTDMNKFSKLSSKYARIMYEKSSNDIDHVLLLGEA